MESIRVKVLHLPVTAFCRILKVERHNYLDYVQGRRRTRDWLIARMLANLNQYLAVHHPKEMVEMKGVL